MGKKRQWNVRADQQLIDRLTTLAKQFNFDSPNELAFEMLDSFAEVLAPMLVEQRESVAATRARQREELMGKALAPPTHRRARKVA